MRAVSESCLKEKQALLISDVTEAMRRYHNRILSLSAPDYERMIRWLTALNGPGSCYVDFYYGRLSEEEQERVLVTADEEEQKLLMSLQGNGQDVYFFLEEDDDAWVKLICRLNAGEMLFSTFYFTRYPCTLWGNYGLQYPVFWEDEEVGRLLDQWGGDFVKAGSESQIL